MKKKGLALLLSILTLGACAGCDSGSVKHGEATPVYTSDKEFHLGMWVGVPSVIKTYDDYGNVKTSVAITDEEFDYHYKLISEAGFNYVDPGILDYSYSYNQRALAAAEKYNLNQYVRDYDILNLLLDDVQDDEVVDAKLAELAKRYTGYKSFAGVKVKDEPLYAEIKDYVKAKERFDKAFGNKIFYMNLLSSIVTKDRLGSDYKDYIKEYVDKIGTDYVSYDHYPLKVNQQNGEYYLLEIFLDNMEMVKEAAGDKDMWTFLQCIEYSPNNRTLTSVADATFQAYSFLAYGGDGIQWFCYWSPPPYGAETFGEGCIGHDGKPTAIYDYVKTTNLEIRGLEDIYFNFDWQGVMTKIGSENEDGGENSNFNYLTYKVMKSHDRIKSFKTQQDTLTGVFKDKDGRDGFMIVNFTEPSKGLKNKVQLEFNDCTHAIVVKKGKAEEVEVKKGKLTFTMDAGEGYFVIPLK